MRGSSADSLRTVTEYLGSAVDGGGDAARIADDLFAVCDVLRREPTLRRVATDVSVESRAKSDLVRQLFGDGLDDRSMDLVANAVGLRWSATRDLGDALEQLGVIAVVRDADGAGQADALEDQMFEVARVVEDNVDLRDALSDTSRSFEDRRALVRDLLADKATAPTVRLVEQALSGTYRTVSLALDAYRKIAAEHRDRLVAVVRVARGLDDREVQRLESALSSQYDRPVHVNVLVDPAVIGGVKVQIGDDVIDGSVASRLDDARRRLAG